MGDDRSSARDLGLRRGQAAGRWRRLGPGTVTITHLTPARFEAGDSFESLCARLVQHALLTNSQDVTVRQKVLCALHFCIGIIPKSSGDGHCVSQQALSEEDFRDEEVAVQDVNEEIDLRGLAVLNNLITTHFQ
ncbi:hypothetical protein EVAR_21898_1 [Eumeta japonica]|uniref:Uncharacterized protein n=1 Tax=Eumeta variegata TaxID=151549 RepID=A0A4C1XF79_EUMVA|nr:hypothetical protein EVAR_21898_1 [Eumeta japonica]